jgi:hypothetical protein
MQVHALVDVTSHSIESLPRRVLYQKYDFAFEILSTVNNQINCCLNHPKLIMVFDRICRLSMRAPVAKHFERYSVRRTPMKSEIRESRC